MQIQSATYNRDENSNPISVRVISDEGQADVPLQGTNWWNQALTAWLAADPANQIGG